MIGQYLHNQGDSQECPVQLLQMWETGKVNNRKDQTKYAVHFQMTERYFYHAVPNKNWATSGT